MSKEVSIKVLQGLHKDITRIQDLMNYGVTASDFGDLAPVFSAFKDAYDNDLPLSLEHLSKTGLSDPKKALTVLENSISHESYLYAGKELLIIKQNAERQVLMQSYQKRILAEKDYKKVILLSSEMTQKINELDNRYVTDSEKSLTDIIPEVYSNEHIRKPVSTGYEWLDEMIGGGFYPGLPSICAGDSGHGKSTLMKNIVLRQTLKPEYGGKGMKVLVASLELTREYLAQQIISLLALDSIAKWRNFNISPSDMEDRKYCALKLAELCPGLMIDDSSYTPQKLARKIRQSKGKYDCIWVDYFQALEVDGENGEGMAFNKASRMVTQAIKETKDVALVLLSQVTGNGGDSVKTEKNHRESKLRYAKQLLNDTALEIIVYRDEKKEDDPSFNADQLNVYVRKNRMAEPEIHTKVPFLKSFGLIGELNTEKLRKANPMVREPNQFVRTLESRPLKPQFVPSVSSDELVPIPEEDMEPVFDESPFFFEEEEN